MKLGRRCAFMPAHVNPERTEELICACARVRIVVFSRPEHWNCGSVFLACSPSAAFCSGPLRSTQVAVRPKNLKWAFALDDLYAFEVQVKDHHVWRWKQGSEEDKRGRGGIFFPCTTVGANSFWSHLFIFVRPQAVATLVDIRILNSQSAYLENESQKEDKGRRSVKAGDGSPSWQRDRLRPVWSSLVWSDGSTNECGQKEEIWKQIFLLKVNGSFGFCFIAL